jgi:hypothetical protein
MGQGGFGGQYETGMSSKRSPDERSDIRGGSRISRSLPSLCERNCARRAARIRATRWLMRATC